MSGKNTLKRNLKLLVIVSLMALTATVAFAQESPQRSEFSRQLPAQVSGLKLDAPVSADAEALAARRLETSLRGATGR
ncbi:MAG: hypothetical protein K1X50_18425, partial [Candidatus Promineofilum sp.]|nr:hypothetical protein [Promineifilum sp.]